MFARRWANAAGKFWKVIGRMQSFEGLLPLTAIHEVIPFRNEIAEWATAGHTERNATVHTASSLGFDTFFAHLFVVLFKMLDALIRVLNIRNLAFKLHKTFDVTHDDVALFRYVSCYGAISAAASAVSLLRSSGAARTPSAKARRYSCGNTFTNLVT